MTIQRMNGRRDALWQPQYLPRDTDQLHCVHLDCSSDEIPEIASSLAADMASRLTAPVQAFHLHPAPQGGWYVMLACDVTALGKGA